MAVHHFGATPGGLLVMKRAGRREPGAFVDVWMQPGNNSI
jgi:hypothetical protein